MACTDLIAEAVEFFACNKKQALSYFKQRNLDRLFVACVDMVEVFSIL